MWKGSRFRKRQHDVLSPTRIGRNDRREVCESLRLLRRLHIQEDVEGGSKAHNGGTATTEAQGESPVVQAEGGEQKRLRGKDAKDKGQADAGHPSLDFDSKPDA